ncbi:uracil-DNA glycosylase [Gracilibacillus caseinilyticus]|uniref:Uracil-DNA glycosylase n=1 Tax=Gracilibacillus caseinilyticus TaxID=2932256 RepID=A0ABY4EYR6_9BACI|nr:uracil-DNA glycosylase [Gracilibacillus caseinilyticus]UOQ49047.1 uracil-DNA glycosylase [Gracilibacillus caseinilyticus]
MTEYILHNDWANWLEPEFQKDYYQQLRAFLKEEYQHQTIYPNMYDIFNALHYTSFEKVKVVILGQDPYHGPDQAHGLSFSVKPEVSLPPSLRNIYKELHADLGHPIPSHGYLVDWAKQGVLLLNNVLTVRQGQAHSHRGKGWEQFTDQVIQTLNQKQTPVVYILWGAAAQKKQALIDLSKHYVIKSPHPSPLSAHRGFFGSKPFSKTNQLLEENGLEPIDWEIRS